MTDVRASAQKIAEGLRQAGHEVWFVGGCVRDRLLGLSQKDIDIVTSARPEEINALYSDCRFVGQKFGISLVVVDALPFEVATFRKDGAYRDHRRPDSVDFGGLEDDARRRDFTINAIFENPFTDDLYDPFGGRADIEAKQIRCVGDPSIRFQEDALRLLRAIRFAARFGFSIERQTLAAIKDLAPTIQYISPERHRDELTRMFVDPNGANALRLLDECGLLYFLLPEIHAMHGVEQGKEYHPEGDVFVHTALVLEKLEPRDAIKAWGALLHDVGKPPTFQRDAENGKITFYEHQRVGADMTEIIMDRLRFPRDQTSAVRHVVARHMTFMNAFNMRKSTLRRFLSADTMEHDLAVHRADCLGSHGNLDAWYFCKEKLSELEHNAEPVLPPALLNGHDLISLGVQPGPRIGTLLRELQDEQIEGLVTTREEALLSIQKKLQIP